MPGEKHIRDGFEPLPTNQRAKELEFGSDIWGSLKDDAEKEDPDGIGDQSAGVLILEDDGKSDREQVLKFSDIKEILHNPRCTAVFM